MSEEDKKENLKPQDDSEASSSDYSEYEQRHDEAYTGNEEVTIDFEGRAPMDPDHNGISQLLQRVFLRAHINCAQMAKMIIAQNFVGSVIYQCESDGPESDTEDLDNIFEDDTVFGITTVLNITAKKAEPCVSEFRNYILNRAAKHAPDTTNAFIRDLLNDDAREVGYLINERFINIPAAISVPLLENLMKEIEQAKDKKMKFDFHYLLMVIKMFRKESKKGRPAEDTYTNNEEELLAERAKDSFEFSTATECDSGLSGDWLEGDPRLMPYRKVLIFERSQFPQLIEDIKSFLNGD